MDESVVFKYIMIILILVSIIGTLLFIGPLRDGASSLAESTVKAINKFLAWEIL